MSYLARVGARVRRERHRRGLTIKGLAGASGLSARYIALAEAGDANLSLVKARALAHALELRVEQLVAEVADERPLLALLGVRGAGKSSVGRRLAGRLERPFVELDEHIEAVADLSLAEVFAVHGEDYYRRLETRALDRLIADGDPVILATGGSIVTHGENFQRLRDAATTVWLRADPEDHWDRVILQGDRRPMRDHPDAMAELRRLLVLRAPLYGEADHVVETSGRSLDAVVDALAGVLASSARAD